MREILFRGKRKDNGEWVEGFLFQTKEHTYIAYTEQFDDDLFLSPKNIFIEVIPETVGQFTGLTANGTKIFEGDIVEGQDYGEEDGYGVVTWDDGAFWVGNNHVCGTFCDNYYGYEFEVIGNIHDKKELLEGGVQ